MYMHINNYKNHKFFLLYWPKKIISSTGQYLINPLTPKVNQSTLYHLHSNTNFSNTPTKSAKINLTYSPAKPTKKRRKPSPSKQYSSGYKSNNLDFFFEQEWNSLVPIALRMGSFRRVAPEFSTRCFESQNNDLFVKILLPFTKVVPKRFRNRAVHDFMSHFSDMKSRCSGCYFFDFCVVFILLKMNWCFLFLLTQLSITFDTLLTKIFTLYP